MNQSERDKIVKAGEYLEAVYDGITDPGVGGKGNTIKEKVYGKLFKEKGQASHHYIKLEEKTVDENGNIIEKDLNEKANRVQALVDSFAADLKYEGETPRILIGDLPPGVEAFASPENNTIAIDRKVLALADANKVLTLVGHELGHFNSYDAKTESTAKRVEDAIQGTKNKGKYTEKIEKEFQEKYAGRDISGSEAQKVIDGIFRMMKELEVFEGEVSPTKKTVTVKKNDVEVIHCNTSGIFIPKIQIGSFVRENQVLGCIVRPILGAELEEVKSSCDGMIFSLREYPAVCEGELLARICKAERPAGKYE